MDVVIPLHLQTEWGGEGQVLQLHSVDIHLLRMTGKINSVYTQGYTSFKCEQWTDSATSQTFTAILVTGSTIRER